MTYRNRLLFVLVVAAPLALLLFLAVQKSVFAEDATPVDFETVNEKCVYEAQEEPLIQGQEISVRKKLRVELKEKYRVKIFMRNTGNMPWFSATSGCGSPIVSLGTAREKNRKSDMFNPDISEDDNNWGTANRVYMDQARVNPGEIASFTFWTKAGKKDDVLKEYFALVVDDTTWPEGDDIEVDTIVGDPDIDYKTMRKIMLFAGKSGSAMDINLDGEKEIKVNLSEQKMYLSLDGDVVKEFLVSTGKSSTPTPTGNYSIKLKQDTRVGGEKPHYIMDNFMWFKDGGYGIHALPRLRTDGGRFWEEAKDHIGRPVSHGCIRLLPDDAKLAFEFADLGTKVVIER